MGLQHPAATFPLWSSQNFWKAFDARDLEEGRKGGNSSHTFYLKIHYSLKGLSHEIFMVIFWLEWIHLG
jgi:hypothetical protein